MMELQFMRLPIALPCPVPIVPGDPETMRDGEPIPLEERTELCAVNAFWMVGGQVSCDVHMRVFCEIAGVDYEGLALEAGGAFEDEERPWEERKRYDQDKVGVDELHRKAWSEGKVVVNPKNWRPK